MRRGVGNDQHGQQYPFDGNELVAGFLCQIFGRLQNLCKLLGRIAGDALPRHFGQLIDGFDRFFQRFFRIAARAPDQAGTQPFLILKQHLQQMLRCQKLVFVTLRERVGGLDKPFASVGKLFDIHLRTLSLSDLIYRCNFYGRKMPEGYSEK